MKTRNVLIEKRGFTLIELMVAMGIAILIMAILVGITNLAMGAWQRSRAEVRASRQAKTMLDAMAKDLECFVMRPGNVNEWLSASTESKLPGSDKGDNIISTNAAEFLFFTAASDRYRGGAGTAADLGGDVCTVSYKLAYKDPLQGLDNNNSNNSTFVFYRQLVDPRPTFDTLLGKPDLRGAFKASAGNNRFENQATAGANNTDAKYNFMCENVYQYSITFLVDVTTVVSGSNLVSPVRVTLGQHANAKDFRLFGDRIEALDPNDKPIPSISSGRLRGVEISITVLSDFGINQLKQRPPFSSPEAKAQFLAQHSYEFSKTVDLPGM